MVQCTHWELPRSKCLPFCKAMQALLHRENRRHHNCPKGESVLLTAPSYWRLCSGRILGLQSREKNALQHAQACHNAGAPHVGSIPCAVNIPDCTNVQCMLAGLQPSGPTLTEVICSKEAPHKLLNAPLHSCRSAAYCKHASEELQGRSFNQHIGFIRPGEETFNLYGRRAAHVSLYSDAVITKECLRRAQQH